MGLSMGFKAWFAISVLAFAAGVGVGMAASGGSSPPPPSASDTTDPRLERLSAQIERLERQLAEEKARREAIDERAQRLYETLKRLHGQLVSQAADQDS